MSILKDIDDLVSANVISAETASKIEDYYKENTSNNSSRLLAAFGVLGAILIGLGIILIIAHNWDSLSRTIKVALSFIPLIIGQLACFYTLYKKEESMAWREASAVFLFFSIGASIALISQIYHIPGNLSSFIFTWMLLALPIIYIMKSGSVGLMYIFGFTYYAVNTAYFSYPQESGAQYYWLFLISIIPFYFNYLIKQQASNFLLFFNWFLAISISVCLSIIVKTEDELLYATYFFLFSLLYFIGKSQLFKQQSLGKNAWLVVGSLGMMVLLFVATFRDFWIEMNFTTYFGNVLILTIVLVAVNTFFFAKKYLKEGYKKIVPFDVVFIIFLIIFSLKSMPLLVAILANLLILTLGVFAIWKGTQTESLVKLNSGILIIGILIACRFFDSDLSFVFRGVLFVLVGAGFFAANYLMLKKIKKDEK